MVIVSTCGHGQGSAGLRPAATILCNNSDVVVLTAAEILEETACICGAEVGPVPLTTLCVHCIVVSSVSSVPHYGRDRSVTVVVCGNTGRGARR